MPKKITKEDLARLLKKGFDNDKKWFDRIESKLEKIEIKLKRLARKQATKSRA